VGGTRKVAAAEDVIVWGRPPRGAECWAGKELVSIGEEDGVLFGSGDEDDAHWSEVCVVIRLQRKIRQMI